MKNVLQQQLSYLFTRSSNQVLNLNIFSFLSPQTFLLINTISLCFDPWIICHPLASLFLISWLFPVLFWLLWMLVTLYRTCHVPHASRITASVTLFTERLFSVSKETVRSWSHAFLIIYHRTFAENLMAVRPKSCPEGEKEKEKESNCNALYAKAETQKEKEILLQSIMR